MNHSPRDNVNPGASVAIAIVTYNSAKYIRKCLEYVLAQTYPVEQVIVVDNASSDDTVRILEDFEARVTIICNAQNVGFAQGQNQAIFSSQSDWVLTLNPDVRLTEDFVSLLVAAGDLDRQAGTVCGKLLTMHSDFEIPEHPVFDSTGIFFTPNLRHLDRASGTPDDGRFDRHEYVFGSTGAAALYRRSMIDDISFEGEFFDSDFFAYREDADIAWRAQLLGWKCLYTPRAVAYHVRSVLPSNRQSLPPVINMHSVKNRFLLRIKNTTAHLYRRHWLRITARDCLVIAGCLLREWSSLPALPLVGRAFSRAWRWRRHIMRHRRVSHDYIAGWFSSEPVSMPAPQFNAMPSHGEKMASR